MAGPLAHARRKWVADPCGQGRKRWAGWLWPKGEEGGWVEAHVAFSIKPFSFPFSIFFIISLSHVLAIYTFTYMDTYIHIHP
jgi:hypothetical protein